MNGNCLACGMPDGPGHSCYEPIKPAIDPRDARIAELERASDLAIEINNGHVQRIHELEKAQARYELVRTLKPAEFQAIFDRNLITGEHFDDLVDMAIKNRSLMEKSSHE